MRILHVIGIFTSENKKSDVEIGKTWRDIPYTSEYNSKN